jgi:hypothetical protein
MSNGRHKSQGRMLVPEDMTSSRHCYERLIGEGEANVARMRTSLYVSLIVIENWTMNFRLITVRISFFKLGLLYLNQDNRCPCRDWNQVHHVCIPLARRDRAEDWTNEA